jgi:hypothetical protein
MARPTIVLRQLSAEDFEARRRDRKTVPEARQMIRDAIRALGEPAPPIDAGNAEFAAEVMPMIVGAGDRRSMSARQAQSWIKNVADRLPEDDDAHR